MGETVKVPPAEGNAAPAKETVSVDVAPPVELVAVKVPETPVQVLTVSVVPLKNHEFKLVLGFESFFLQDITRRSARAENAMIDFFIIIDLSGVYSSKIIRVLVSIILCTLKCVKLFLTSVNSAQNNLVGIAIEKSSQVKSAIE